MLNTKTKGDIGQLKVAGDLLMRGYTVSFPYGDNARYDLVLDRGTGLERVQVKYVTSNGQTIIVQCKSVVSVANKLYEVRKYTESQVDWIACYDATSNCCYYIPGTKIGEGRTQINLRLEPTNPRITYANIASDYTEI